MKRILIDGRFVGVGESIARYVLELTKELLKIDTENQYTLLIRPVGRKELDWYPEVMNAKNLKVVELDIPHYSLSEQTKLLSYLNEQKFDLVHFAQFNHPVNYKGNYVVTIHDFTLIGRLRYNNFIKQLAFSTVMKSAIKDAHHIISISKYTLRDLQNFCPTDKSKISIIYHGLDHDKFNAGIRRNELGIRETKEKYNILGDYILYVGGWKKHKNLLRMLQAYEKFIITCHSERSEESHSLPKLVMVGTKDAKESQVLAEINRINSSLNSLFLIPNSIILTGSVNIRSDDLPKIYAGALAYIIPSLSEGFGWPPLEAMACGAPVIASKESCIPEILGDAALYFDPYNTDDIEKSITKIVTDEKLRQDLSDKGLDHVKKYDWSNTAKETLEVYNKALK